jgi:hypothetical protein
VKIGFAVILVHSTGYAIQVEKLLKRQGVETRLIPVPRHLSSDCGVCVRISVEQGEHVLALLAEARLEIEGYHPLPG